MLFIDSIQQLPTETREKPINAIAKQATAQIYIGKLATQTAERKISNRLDSISLIPIGFYSGDEDRNILKAVWISGL